MMTTIKRNCANSLHVAYMDLIPEDILIEILRRVPLEFILSCKLVSNKWKIIINDPMFFKAYSNQTCTAFFLGLQRLYCLFTRPSNPEPAIPTIAPPFVVREIPIGLRDPTVRCHYHYNFILLNSGWSNGWTGCFNERGALFLFHNLFTGASFKVKNAPMRGHALSWICYGFGYDPLGDDYVILVVCSNYHSLSQGSRRKRILGKNRFQNEDNSWFWVYSFGSKCWKRSSGFPYSSEEVYEWLTPNKCRAPLAHCINGVLHWLVFNKETQTDIIVTYNLHSGTFGEFSSVPEDATKDPPCWPPDVVLPHIQSTGTMCYTRSLAHLNGQLCFISKTDCKHPGLFSYTFKYEMWVMKEYGFGDSWEKLATIDCTKITDSTPDCILYRHFTVEGSPWRWDCVTPGMLYEGGDGKKLVLFVCHYYQKLFWYDVAENKVEFVDRKSWHRAEWKDSLGEWIMSMRGYI